MKQPYYSLNGIKKVFSTEDTETLVLDGIDLSINKHEFVSIIGSSACGKSTLLKIAGGIIPATLGSITFNRENFEKLVPKEKIRNFGFVFQQHNLFPWRTCEKNLKLSLEVMKLKGEKWNNRVHEMLQLVGLEEYKDIYPHEMSGGMMQRVGIARALVHDPKIILMDQPFGALDAITRNMLSLQVLNIWRTTKKTFLMVTNSAEEALLMSDKVVVLSNKPSKIIYQSCFYVAPEQRNLTILKDPEFLKKLDELNDVIRSLSSKEEI